MAIGRAPTSAIAAKCKCHSYFMRAALIAVLCLAAVRSAKAQSCPMDSQPGPARPSVSRMLSGKVVYHDEIRKWFELSLDAPVCGEKKLQLLVDQRWIAIASRCGCNIAPEEGTSISRSALRTTTFFVPGKPMHTIGLRAATHSTQAAQMVLPQAR